MAEDVPKRVIVVLLILAVVVSFLGTLTFLEVYNSVSLKGDTEGSAQGVVKLSIQRPGEPASSSGTTGQVAVTIEKP